MNGLSVCARGGGAPVSSHTQFEFPALITEVDLGVFVPETFHQAILRDAWLLGRRFSSSVRIKGRVLGGLAPACPWPATPAHLPLSPQLPVVVAGRAEDLITEGPLPHSTSTCVNVHLV